ncbi:MAG: transglutaminase family protein [Gammaproteobacteria bacterium]|nr:transglutaminase family protein [Gammaproteobacteria bacterium]MCP5458092.1 transglutaminase family protein [Gammaproteobacteria bacterium]
MLFTVTHETLYTYSQPVVLGPHIIRLCPRHDGAQRTLNYELRIEPKPLLRSECLDAEGNSVTHAWFDGSTTTFQVISSFSVETCRDNPFDYFLERGCEHLSSVYRDDVKPRLSYYRSAQILDDRIRTFSNDLAAEAEGQPLAFLAALNHWLHENIVHEIRDEGAPQNSTETLTRRKGACRDLSVLFMAACQTQGLAVRFVSGYRKGDGRRPKRYLHAWPEVFISGGGWRGYDPTQGAAVADEHVALAAALHPVGTMPIEGSFGGAGATSTMDFDLRIETSG